MVDRNQQNFQGRLWRIRRDHAKGAGFEAEGTLGMSYYNAHRRRPIRPRLLAMLLLMAMVFTLLKAGLLATRGEDMYEARLAALQRGSDLDRSGAWLLQIDPVTRRLAEAIRRLTG